MRFTTLKPKELWNKVFVKESQSVFLWSEWDEGTKGASKPEKDEVELSQCTEAQIYISHGLRRFR